MFLKRRITIKCKFHAVEDIPFFMFLTRINIEPGVVDGKIIFKYFKILFTMFFFHLFFCFIIYIILNLHVS